MRHFIKLILFFLLVPCFGYSQKNKINTSEQPIELGDIKWLRNYNQALKEARLENKPILILFQEIPGCATCRNYGQNILTHPLIVDAIQHEFIPLAIYNNKQGEDSRILRKYNEPSWNNPVVRIINHNELELADRLSGDYTKSGLVLKMKLALLRSHGKIPPYFATIADELIAEDSGLQTSYFNMYCFWTGEAHLGSLDGVINTSPGFMSCGEVVQVNYDPQLLDEKDLLKHAESKRFKTVKNRSRFRDDIDPQYYLKQSQYAYLPLTPAQRTKINSALGLKEDATAFLSPTQKKWYNGLSSNKKFKEKNLYTKSFLEAWEIAQRQYEGE